MKIAHLTFSSGALLGAASVQGLDDIREKTLQDLFIKVKERAAAFFFHKSPR